jgi:hypothetical protein
MAKKSRKLSLKKETLRQLDDKALGQVAGGNYYLYADAFNYGDAVMLRQPSRTVSAGCTTELFAFNNYYRLY